MTRTWRCCVSLLALCCVALLPAQAAALPAYGITTTGELVIFDTDVPDLVDILRLTGLQPDEQILAIDIRAIDRRVYGLSSGARLYRIEPFTGLAEWVGGALIGIPLAGVDFAMDWDPVNDQFRVIGSTGQNFRLSPVNGQVIDADENAPGIQPDTPFAPALEIRAAAFTNNYAGPASSRLFMIVGQGNRLDYTDTPSAGTSTVVGGLGVNMGNEVAFDIVGPTNSAYLVLPQGNGSRLFTVNLATGEASPGPVIGQGLASQRLRAFAVKWSGDILRAVTMDNQLVRFHSMTPDRLLSATPITGLQPLERILGLAFRPPTPDFDVAYALGSTGRLYRLTATGQATQVGLGSFLVPLDGTRFGFAFNPFTNDIHVISDTGQNLRIDPDTGLMVDSDIAAEGVQIDSPVDGAVTPAALAYVPNPFGVVRNAFYGFDVANGRLFRLGGEFATPSPSTGQVTPLSATLAVEPDTPVGLDWSRRDNLGYLSVVEGGVNVLRRVSPSNAITDVGVIGMDLPPVTALAIEPVSFWRMLPEYFDFTHPEKQFLGAFSIARTNTSETGYIRVGVRGGSATRNTDYTFVDRILTVAPGQSHVGVPFNMIDDVFDEPGETVLFELHMVDPGSGAGGHTIATMRIFDNDGPAVTQPSVQILSPVRGPDTFAPVGTSDTFVTLTGRASGASPIVRVTWHLDVGGGFVEAAGTANGIENWTIAHLPLLNGDNRITVLAHDANGLAATDSITLRRSLDRYSLAEGATGTFFDLDIAIANPNPVEAPVDITFLTPSGATVQQQRILPPASRTTIKVDEIPGLESTEVSTLVTQTSSPTLPLAVERTMRWDTSGYGTHTEKAVHGSGALTWYFAEGSQGFFDSYFLLANPGDTQNDALVEMFTEDGAPAASRQYSLPPRSRLTVHAGEIAALQNRSFWTKVTFTTFGIAERAMYFGAPLFNGGHESHGITMPSTTWFHAEGAIGTFFTTFLLLANPNDQAAQVTLTYLVPDAPPVVVQKVLPARARVTINVAFDALLVDAAVATHVESSLPILSERSMYWPGTPANWYEAHNSFGETVTDTTWALAEGLIGGAQNQRTYILLANPGEEAATVTIAYLREGAPLVQKQYVVPRTSRFNIDVGAMVPELSNEAFGAFIRSTHPIFVERSMYADAAGLLWSAGTNATATRVP
jgi:hypothetical protein